MATTPNVTVDVDFHWILHHAPKPHPPVKPNRRVDELRAVAVEVIAEEAATDGS